MTSENQLLFDGIRAIVAETMAQTIAPLTERVDVLTERVDALADRTERMEIEQRDQRTLLNAMSTQVSSTSLHVSHPPLKRRACSEALTDQSLSEQSDSVGTVMTPSGAWPARSPVAIG
ncbi:MAG: hypothetical protein ACJ8CR_35380 [Roseiflexaceae bacterium]